jgi:Arc/MetJ-type ribon-helix-helix transcriptional regulator
MYSPINEIILMTVELSQDQKQAFEQARQQGLVNTPSEWINQLFALWQQYVSTNQDQKADREKAIQRLRDMLEEADKGPSYLFDSRQYLADFRKRHGLV